MREGKSLYLNTSPNLSDMRIVCESFVNITEVGFLGSSLAPPSV